MNSTEPLTATEREWMIRLNVAHSILVKAAEYLQGRMHQVPYGSRDIAMIAKRIDRLLDMAEKTIPREQYLSYKRNLRMSDYTVGVKGPARGTPREDEYGMWVSLNELNALVDGCHDHCAMCMLDKYGQKKCPIRRALDEIPNDVPHPMGGECPYMSEI